MDGRSSEPRRVMRMWCIWELPHPDHSAPRHAETLCFCGSQWPLHGRETACLGRLRPRVGGGLEDGQPRSRSTAPSGKNMTRFYGENVGVDWRI